MTAKKRGSIMDDLKTELVNLSPSEEQRLINYSNTYYKKYGARVLKLVNGDAYMVQYLDNVDAKLTWNNAFCVNRQQLNLILYGQKERRIAV